MKKQDKAEVAAPTKDPNLLVTLASNIVASYFTHNQVPRAEIPTFVQSIHNALKGLQSGTPTEAEERKPAVSIKKSVADDYLICLEDGKKLTMLKRYLKTQYNMSPEEYRKKWDLPHDYPMVAPAYARMRSAFAKKIGLGKVPNGKGRKKK